MQWKTLSWEEIDRDALYALLQLRSEVFVVEQDCVYQDLDDKDAKGWHVVGWDGGQCVATARILPPQVSYAEPSIGRVVVAKSHRLSGIGRRLMGEALAACLDRWPSAGVRISAQSYLETFYQSLGFEACSAPYLEDGLPHIQMFRRGLPSGVWDPICALGGALDAWERAIAAMPPELIFGSSDSWRAGAITDHLVAAESATWQAVSYKVQAGAEALPALDEESEFRAAALSNRLRSNEQYAMPAGLPEPTAVHDASALEALFTRWRAAQSEGRVLLAGLPTAWWHMQVFRHPLAGRLGLSDTVQFLADHIAHHHHQLRRLMGEEE